MLFGTCGRIRVMLKNRMMKIGSNSMMAGNKWRKALMISALAMLAAAMLVSASSNATTSSSTSPSGEKLIGAGLAFGLAAGGAGVGMGTAGAAIVSASLEKRDMVMFLLVLAFVETIAIYGIVIAILIMSHP